MIACIESIVESSIVSEVEVNLVEVFELCLSSPRSRKIFFTLDHSDLVRIVAFLQHLRVRMGPVNTVKTVCRTVKTGSTECYNLLILQGKLAPLGPLLWFYSIYYARPGEGSGGTIRASSTQCSTTGSTALSIHSSTRVFDST